MASPAGNIKVVARFRPQNSLELTSGGETFVEFESDDTCQVHSREVNANNSFTFDRIFGMDSRQTDVFDYSISSTVDDIMNGYNGTVFAYGQTGAGKSYTMMGSNIDDPEGKGIIPRIVEQVFQSIHISPGNMEYTVRISYMEIYMERIRDLLAPQNDNLPVHEEKSRGVYVKGLLEVYVSSIEEVYEVMRTGDAARAVSATNMNQESSRSHSIFVVTITQKNLETGSAKSGQLFLVDLAGSEKVGKTGASGQTLEEAKKINKSLSALGMVINALTDGKSSHVPYRDSKLTRILQESLGGNSRTTLIINCSPSSYNDAETLSTLRFGVRAKAIKNKAKINSELSPAELKQLLRKAQTKMTSFETYTSALESEVQLWRAGDPVPREKWAPPRSEAGPGIGAGTATGAAKTPAPSTTPVTTPGTPGTPEPKARPPSRLQQQQQSQESNAGSRPESRIGDHSSTPSIILERDEREEFLRRENELQDQVAEKEIAVTNIEKELLEKQEELKLVRENATRAGKDNEKLSSEINELRMQWEKVSYESKEATILMDSLKDDNAELTTELDELRRQLLDVRMTAKQTTAALDEKERKKSERTAKMMAIFDLGVDVFSDNERKIQQLIERIDAIQAASSPENGSEVNTEEFVEIRSALLEAKGVIRQAELAVTTSRDADENAAEQQQKQRERLEKQLEDLQHRYEEILEGKLSNQDVSAIKEQLAKAYSIRSEREAQELAELRQEMEKSREELSTTKKSLTASQAQAQAASQAHAEAAEEVASATTPTMNGKTLQQQIGEFDMMKKSLMRDLQNRCERVVELEISLDETREQYKNVVQSSNNRAQQKKMVFLERNLEQLRHVQRQLVEQNESLKREVAVAERKLTARNERIESLETLLQDSQEKLTTANHRFESQLTAVKERLEAAKAGSTRGGGGAVADGGGFSFSGSRIAKPLRGGGPTAIAATPISNLQQQEQGTAGKRSSWFFNQR